MKWLRWIIVFLAGALCLSIIAMGLFYFSPHDERTTAALHQSSGQIRAGRRFLVTVGDSWAQADGEIRSQFTPSYVLCETPSKPPVYSDTVDGPVLVGEAVVSYRDGSWRNGSVSLKLRDGKVVEVDWTYNPFYVDL